MGTTTITSVLTPGIGETAPTTQRGTITPTVSITGRDRQDVASIPDPAWLIQRADSEDSVAEGSTAAEGVFTKAVAGSTAEEVGGATVGNQ
jgi:hypothetical protein